MVGFIISIALHICLKRGMIFWKYKWYLLRRHKNWRKILRGLYGYNQEEMIDELTFRTGAKYPILKPLGLCIICTSFWIGLFTSFSFVNACLTMVLMYLFLKIEKKYFS